MVFIRIDNRYGFPYSRIRTQKGTLLEAINPTEPAVEAVMKLSDFEGSGMKGFGIKGFGIDIFHGSGGLVRVDDTLPEELKKKYLVVKGAGISSLFKDKANRIVSWGRKNGMPILKASLKKLLQEGKRIGADVAVNIADDGVKLGTQLIDKNVKDPIISGIAKAGVSQLGKQVKNRSNAYLDEEEKVSPFSKAEDKLAHDIAQRSRAQLQKLMAKNNAPAKGNGMASFIKR